MPFLTNSVCSIVCQRMILYWLIEKCLRISLDWWMVMCLRHFKDNLETKVSSRKISAAKICFHENFRQNSHFDENIFAIFVMLRCINLTFNSRFQFEMQTFHIFHQEIGSIVFYSDNMMHTNTECWAIPNI